MRKLSVAVTQYVELDKDEIDRIFHHKLNELTDGMWIEKDILMTEHYTSHRFDSPVAKVTDPQHEIAVAAIRLRTALKAKENKK